MPPFVVLQHDFPVLHWDFMLDCGDALRTWRLAEPPRAGVSTPCEALPAHRRAYLDYEGPVSGGRGVVKRMLAGRYQLLEETAEFLRLRLELPGGNLEARLAPPSGLGQASFAAIVDGPAIGNATVS